MIIGEDIQIFIDEVEYTTKISDFKESGGDNIYSTKKCYGNSYKKVQTGKNAYKLELDFICEDDTLQALMTITEPISIILKDEASNITITYNNMLPDGISYKPSVTDYMSATLSYSCPPYDSNGDDNRQVE